MVAHLEALNMRRIILPSKMVFPALSTTSTKIRCVRAGTSSLQVGNGTDCSCLSKIFRVSTAVPV